MGQNCAIYRDCRVSNNNALSVGNIMVFDPSINIGTILNMVGLFVAAIAMYARTAKTFTVFEINYRNMSAKLERLEGDIEKLTKVTEVIALQKERLIGVDTRIADIVSDIKEYRISLEKRLNTAHDANEARFKEMPTKSDITLMISSALEAKKAVARKRS